MPANDAPLTQQILQGVGPFAAAAVALYLAGRAERRERRRRPDLALLFDASADDFEASAGPPRTPSHWVRLRVANRWGKDTAEDVEVLVVSSEPHPGAPSLNGYALVWSNAQTARGEPLTTQTIAPGVARHVDLLRIVGPTPERHGHLTPGGEADVIMDLQVLPKPSDTRHHLGAGDYQIWLALTAKGTDARYYVVTIRFDGKWWPSHEAKEHFKLRVVVAERLSRSNAFRVPRIPDDAWT